MSALGAILVVLFVAFLVGTILRIAHMLERKRAGDDVDRARLVFFFLGCLMLVCMIPIRLFELLSGPVMAADLAVVVTNFLGYGLTYDFGRQGATGEEAAQPATVRAYQIYYRGKKYALISKEGIDVLLAHKLLKRQHTVELIEGFQSEAQRQGVGIRLLRSKADGQSMLLRVEGPAPRTTPGA